MENVSMITKSLTRIAGSKPVLTKTQVQMIRGFLKEKSIEEIMEETGRSRDAVIKTSKKYLGGLGVNLKEPREGTIVSEIVNLKKRGWSDSRIAKEINRSIQYVKNAGVTNFRLGKKLSASELIELTGLNPKTCKVLSCWQKPVKAVAKTARKPKVSIPQSSENGEQIYRFLVEVVIPNDK